jgi:small subunit ribosomal protein S11
MAATKKVVKKRKNIKLPNGVLYINTTENNTIVTLTDPHGNKVNGGGTGSAGFKWAKENTAFAAETVAKKILKEAKDLFGLKELGLVMRGTGLGREWIFKAINELGAIDIMYIKEDTSIQFGGCKGIRPKRN